MSFDRLCIIGVGLIGGSIARAARLQGLSQVIIGFGRQEDLANLQAAKALGVIDDYSLDLAEAVNGADCVVIATPVATIKTILALLQPFWSAQTIYTDVGSTKSSVLDAAEQVFGEIPKNLIPAHPIAGAEQSGVNASVDDLFVGKRLIITPTETSSAKALQAVQGFWEKLGSVVSIMDAKHHDGVLAATSHLPHLLAFALVDMLGRKDEQSDIFKYAAGGFRDFTRIASSDPTMWRDICLANKDELVALLEEFKTQLGTIQNDLQSQDAQQLFQTFSYARNARQRFLDQFED
ncbi:MAG: prephenate dehydrogenase/arogenate dehydrogenase family protein [Methylococcales bacterium]|nr:prephenate dehydrogenase/arogenate dehydrogenase family protein [Methylococcaceae bacterium]